jgi:hypothetical protein
MTLNSVEWNTHILVKIDGQPTKVKIGQFIDDMLDVTKYQIIKNDQYYQSTLEHNLEVPSVDEHGVVNWKKIEAITKHPVVNKDGSDKLIQVRTKSGREVIATKGLSFLTKIDGKIKPINGDEIKVGDVLPINTKKLLDDAYSGICDKTVYADSTGAEKQNDIFWDEIVSIEEVENIHHYVYDFTIADTRTFVLYNNLVQNDTFHLAGLTTVQGMKDIPYINKIIDKINDKTPIITINFKKKLNDTEQVADDLMKKLKQIKFSEIVKSYNIQLMYYEKYRIKVMFQTDIEQIKSMRYDTAFICKQVT